MVVQSAQKSEFLRGLEEVIGSPPPPFFKRLIPNLKPVTYPFWWKAILLAPRPNL